MNNKSASYNLKVYQMIRENGEWEMFKMIEVENIHVMISVKQNDVKMK